MPELPEVEIVKRALEGAALGVVISRVVLNRPDIRFPIPPELPSLLKGQVITSFLRRGKYVVCLVKNGAGFVLHLGMSGVVKIIPADEAYVPAKHDHVVFMMGDGSTVVFNDPRRFGFLDVVRADDWSAYKSFATMGPEPLSNDFSGPVLAAALKGRGSPIKTALLDQKVVAGVGNIYACEALSMAGISPMRKAGTVKGVRAGRLAGCVREVLLKAIESGGSSLKDYYHADGSLGYFQHSFCVYDREGHECSQEGCTKRVKRVVQSGRSTFYCSACQR